MYRTTREVVLGTDHNQGLRLWKTKKAVIARIHEAAKYVPLDRPILKPAVRIRFPVRLETS